MVLWGVRVLALHTAACSDTTVAVAAAPVCRPCLRAQITVLDGVDVARCYASSWRFLVDLISAIPFIYLVRLAHTSGHEGMPGDQHIAVCAMCAGLA